MTETVAPVVVWDYHGTGICPRCNSPEYLFTNNYQTEDSKPVCPGCAIPQARANMYGNFPGMTLSVANTLLTNALREQYDYRTVITGEWCPQYDYRTVITGEWCPVCVKPFDVEGAGDRWERTVAVDSQGNEFTVHRGCCSISPCEHSECRDINYMTSWYLNHVPYLIFPEVRWHGVNIERASGYDFCPNHIEEWMGANDGDWYACDGCGHYGLYSNQGYLHYYDSTYCDNCRHVHFFRCEDCDELIRGDDESDHHCLSGDSHSVIHSYGYKPVPCFFGETRNPVKYHLGFELEVEHKMEGECDSIAEHIQDVLGQRAYLKYDGSLRGGFEIVTHPHTLDEYRDNFPWAFIDEAKNNGLVSWNSPRCGFHIHVSRYAFGPGMEDGESEYEYYRRTIIVRQQHELKFIKLIYDNERQVQRLAGRKSEWAKFTDKGNIWRKVKHQYQSEGHYSAVNVENSSTIEVRVFRGSLKRERLMADLEFVQSAVEYTRNLRVTATNKALSWLAYSGYVYQNADKYPYLLELMDKVNSQEQVYDSRTEDGED